MHGVRVRFVMIKYVAGKKERKERPPPEKCAAPDHVAFEAKIKKNELEVGDTRDTCPSHHFLNTTTSPTTPLHHQTRIVLEYAFRVSCLVFFRSRT